MELTIKTIKCASLATAVCAILNLQQANATSDVSVGAFAVVDASQNLIGGRNTGYTGRALFGANLQLDLSQNYSFYIGGQAFRGKDGSQNTGDIQVYSNIDAQEFTSLFEISMTAQFFQEKLIVKVGQMDANTQFANIDTAAEFINSSMGFSPTITFLPTYPIPTLGVSSALQITNENRISLGVYSDESNDFDETFAITELQHDFGNTTVNVGYWQYSMSVPDLSAPMIADDTHGVYTTSEGVLSLQVFNSRQSKWYFQGAYSDQRYNPIKLHLGAGMIFEGVNRRESDLIGIGISHIETSSFVQDELANTETALELFYKYQIDSRLSIKPDLQYIFSPASERELDDALVFTLRFEFYL